MGKRRVKPPQWHKQSLGEQIEDPESYGVRTKPRPEKRRRRDVAERDDSDEEEQELPAATSSKILKEARAQQEEVRAEAAPLAAAAPPPHALQAAASSDSESDDADDPGLAGRGWRGGGAAPDWDASLAAELEGEGVSPEDEAALAAFMAPGAADRKQRTLADVVMERIREKQEAAGLGGGASVRFELGGAGPGPATPGPGAQEAGPTPEALEGKVGEVYRGVGRVMARYTAGKVPKAFKIIPSLRNWEEVLYLTDPEGWSPHAVYQATRMFVSNLNGRMAQRFLVLVLLPAVRRDIRENRRLHFALFQALRKAAYKPAAFYKGVLLPLCASGSCTLREAVILSSVLRRTSIPALHSAAAMLRIAEMPYSGTNSFFLRVLLDKKYALPYRVVDALVDHFVGFRVDERQMPVVWHQALLCFVQRYKAEVRAEDKAALRALCRAQHHHLVTPEVLRELDASRSRGEAKPAGPTPTQQPKLAGVGEDPRALAPIVMMDDD